jgi:hypothetical protein
MPITSHHTIHIHTPRRPYCHRSACWCHTSSFYHQHVCRSLRVPTTTLYQQALSILLGQTAQRDEMASPEDPGQLSLPTQRG